MWELIVLPALVGSSLVWGAIQVKRQRRLEKWLRAAKSCGLEVEKGSVWENRLELKARAGPLEVRIEPSRQNKYGARIVIVVPEPLEFASVKICRERDKPLWRREIEVGDESFDRTFYVAGPVRLVRALLDAKVRRLLIRESAKSKLEIVQGELRVETSDREIRDLVPILLKLGRRFAQAEDTVRLLAYHARRDPEAGVRLQNLLLLIHELPEDPRTAAALRTALEDSSPMVRLRAAKELGAEGRDVLLALAESKGDDALSAQAISILGGELPFEQARALLALALDRRRIRTACACLERLGHSQDAAAVETLAKIMASEEGELAAAAALALGTTGSSTAEPPLIRALEQERRDLWVAAATALGRVGSAAAVLPLKEAAERSALNLDLRKAARQAIAEIQSRLSSASPGQLSLAASEAGQLSLAQEAGQLSLATGPAPAPK
jgi:HEAT repeat protein